MRCFWVRSSVMPAAVMVAGQHLRGWPAYRSCARMVGQCPHALVAASTEARSECCHALRLMRPCLLPRCIMCVGHNKGWEEAACSWARGAVRLNTACAALFEAAGCSWEEVLTSEAEWKLVDVVTP